MVFITIDDNTGAFLCSEEVKAVIPVDDDKQEKSGYRCLIVTHLRDYGSPLSCTDIRERLNIARGVQMSSSDSRAGADLMQ